MECYPDIVFCGSIDVGEVERGEALVDQILHVALREGESVAL